jgi:hypothetical protein
VRLQGKGLLLGLRSPLALLMKLGVALKADIADCAVNVAIGRKARVDRSPSEGPECAPKLPFNSEREIALTAETLAGRGVEDALTPPRMRVPSAPLLLVLRRTAYDILCVHADASEGDWTSAR